jgi:hypothetical protein
MQTSPEILAKFLLLPLCKTQYYRWTATKKERSLVCIYNNSQALASLWFAETRIAEFYEAIDQP